MLIKIRLFEKISSGNIQKVKITYTQRMKKSRQMRFCTTNPIIRRFCIHARVAFLQRTAWRLKYARVTWIQFTFELPSSALSDVRERKLLFYLEKTREVKSRFTPEKSTEPSLQERTTFEFGCLLQSSTCLFLLDFFRISCLAYFHDQL